MQATEAGDTLLLHHFDDLGQQKDTSNLGMWAFLATEVMFFGALFAAYALYRDKYHEAFAAASRHLYLWVGAINTAVLLCSSLAMARAVQAAQLRQKRQTVRFLVLTLILGTVFLGIKAGEWIVDYNEGLVPGIKWNWEHAQEESKEVHQGDEIKPMGGMGRSYESNEPQVAPGTNMPSSIPAAKAQIFFVLYFVMTGLHAFHMIIGLSMLVIFIYLTQTGWMSGGGATQIEAGGLYWHFVDVVWVFLYPLLYLIEVRS